MGRLRPHPDPGRGGAHRLPAVPAPPPAAPDGPGLPRLAQRREHPGVAQPRGRLLGQPVPRRPAPRPATRSRRLASTAAAGELDGLSLDVVLRLFGLLHDIDLLPLGHTLRYQSGLFAEPAGRPRAVGVRGRHQGGGRRPARLPRATSTPPPASWPTKGRAGARLPVELVNSGLGADLVDFALRDSFAITRRQTFPAGLAEALRLVETDDGWGLALDATDPATARARVALADDLYLARFEVFAASVFHPVKLAADAMLDLALRRLGADACRTLLPEALLLTMGDDELVARLAPAEEAAARRIGAEPVVVALQGGRLHEEAWRTEDLAGFRHRPESFRALALDPAWRDEAEAAPDRPPAVGRRRRRDRRRLGPHHAGQAGQRPLRRRRRRGVHPGRGAGPRLRRARPRRRRAGTSGCGRCASTCRPAGVSSARRRGRPSAQALFGA